MDPDSIALTEISSMGNSARSYQSSTLPRSHRHNVFSKNDSSTPTASEYATPRLHYSSQPHSHHQQINNANNNHNLNIDSTNPNSSAISSRRSSTLSTQPYVTDSSCDRIRSVTAPSSQIVENPENHHQNKQNKRIQPPMRNCNNDQNKKDKNKQQKQNQMFIPKSFTKIDIDDVEFYECCGSGSYGSVYRGRWKSQDREVAIKKLLQMEKEAHILSVLSHKNIVQFYGAVVDPKCCCLVTEYAPYGSLYSFLQRPEAMELNFAQTIYWARDIAVGISYLHNEAPVKVIHRDLKSKNVVIGPDYTLKICDFGASRFLAETATMTLAGTYPWMAPELIQGLPTGESCDTYSFGVVLWELFIQDIPFRDLEGFQVAWYVVEKRERPPLPRSMPDQMQELIESCWDQDPKQRLSMHDVIHVIDFMTEDMDFCAGMDNFLIKRSQWSETNRKERDRRNAKKKNSINSDPKEKERMNNQVTLWENNFRNERAKQTSLLSNVIYEEEEEFNISASFSGENKEALHTLRNIMGGVNLNHTDAAKGTPLSQLATSEVPGFTPMMDSFNRLNYGDPSTNSNSNVKVKASHRRRKSRMSFDPAALPPQVPSSHRQRSHSTKIADAEDTYRKNRNKRHMGPSFHHNQNSGGSNFGSNNSVASTGNHSHGTLQSSTIGGASTFYPPASPITIRKKHSIGTAPNSPDRFHKQSLVSSVGSIHSGGRQSGDGQVSGTDLHFDISGHRSKKAVHMKSNSIHSNPAIHSDLDELMTRAPAGSRTRIHMRKRSSSSDEINYEESHELEDGTKCDVKTLTRVSRSNENFTYDTAYTEMPIGQNNQQQGLGSESYCNIQNLPLGPGSTNSSYAGLNTNRPVMVSSVGVQTGVDSVDREEEFAHQPYYISQANSSPGVAFNRDLITSNPHSDVSGNVIVTQSSTTNRHVTTTEEKIHHTTCMTPSGSSYKSNVSLNSAISPSNHNLSSTMQTPPLFSNAQNGLPNNPYSPSNQMNPNGAPDFMLTPGEIGSASYSSTPSSFADHENNLQNSNMTDIHEVLAGTLSSDRVSRGPPTSLADIPEDPPNSNSHNKKTDFYSTPPSVKKSMSKMEVIDTDTNTKGNGFLVAKPVGAQQPNSNSFENRRGSSSSFNSSQTSKHPKSYPIDSSNRGIKLTDSDKTIEPLVDSDKTLRTTGNSNSNDAAVNNEPLQIRSNLNNKTKLSEKPPIPQKKELKNQSSITSNELELENFQTVETQTQVEKKTTTTTQTITHTRTSSSVSLQSYKSNGSSKDLSKNILNSPTIERQNFATKNFPPAKPVITPGSPTKRGSSSSTSTTHSTSQQVSHQHYSHSKSSSKVTQQNTNYNRSLLNSPENLNPEKLQNLRNFSQSYQRHPNNIAQLRAYDQYIHDQAKRQNKINSGQLKMNQLWRWVYLFCFIIFFIHKSLTDYDT